LNNLARRVLRMLGVGDLGRDPTNVRIMILNSLQLLAIHHQSYDLSHEMLDVLIVSLRFGSLHLHLLLDLFVGEMY
jgi:hypothetical protein